jgi:hypothetical protein
MSVVGIILVVIGFIVLIPGGALPGSTAARNVRIGAMPISQTPGYRPAEERPRRSRLYGTGVGLLLLVAGIVLLVIST